MATFSKRGYRLGRPPLSGWQRHQRDQKAQRLVRTESLEVFDRFCENQHMRILREFHDPYGIRFRNNPLSRQTNTEVRIEADSRDFLRAKQRVMTLGPELHYSEPTEVKVR